MNDALVHLARWQRARVFAMLLLSVFLVTGCSTPTGPNLAALSCACHDQASGGTIILPARICTDLSDPDKVKDDGQTQCDKKETKCIPDCLKIENCGIFDAPVGVGMCPDGSSPEAGGDFGQATAVALSTRIEVTGGDVDDFVTAFDELNIATTQTGDTLEFDDVAGLANEVHFSTPGGLFGIGGGSHTLSDVRLLLKGPFSVPLVDGVFEIPEGVADFVVSAKLDGDFAPLAASSKQLEGVYVEELGLFNLFGQIDPDGADVHLNVSISFQFLNRPPRARAGADQAVECSSPDLTGVANVSDAGSFDLDGDADIARHSWTVDLGQPDPPVFLGRDVSIPLTLGAHVLTLAVADQRGSFGVDAVNVTVADTKGPSLTVDEPQPVAYPHTASVTLDYAVADACAGVAQQVVRLDGATTIAGHGLASGQAIDLLTELSLGTHTFRLEATDALTNASATEVPFTVIATPDSLIDAVRRFAATGAVTEPGIANALEAHARAATRGADSCKRTANLYGTFIRFVRNHTPKKIDPTAAAILIGDAEYLIDHCS
jgi:FIMAH domain-containing protein